MPRGGYRHLKPGDSSANRTDLNAAPRVASGVQSPPVYGEKKQQAESLRAVPLPQSTPVPVTPLGAPTQRPKEDVAAGLPVGPGPGPEALTFGSLDEGDELRAIYRETQSEAIRELIEAMEEGW